MSEYFPKPITPKPFNRIERLENAIIDIEKRLNRIEKTLVKEEEEYNKGVNNG